MAALLTAGRGVQVNAENSLSRTPLHVATLYNSYECWYMLLDAGVRFSVGTSHVSKWLRDCRAR